MTLLALARGVPTGIWRALAVLAVLLVLWRWHDRAVAAGFADGARRQAAVDQARFDAAATAAAATQRALAARLADRQSQISKGTQDAVLAGDADLARRHADLRMRWAAHLAGAGHAREGGAAGLAGTAAGAADAACAAAGWVSLDTAATAAAAADRAIAKDDAWIAWAKAQAAAWPGA